MHDHAVLALYRMSIKRFQGCCASINFDPHLQCLVMPDAVDHVGCFRYAGLAPDERPFKFCAGVTNWLGAFVHGHYMWHIGLYI